MTEPPLRVALYEPDIPQNTGALMRLAACLGVGLDIIEPCGFLLDDRRLRRAGLDYAANAVVRRHDSWARFEALVSPGGERPGRLVLLTTRASRAYTRFAFRPGDVLLLGRESAGVPEAVHQRADASVTIPMQPGQRSLNVALAAAMVLGEALRQTESLPAHPVPGSDPTGDPA